MNDKPLLWLLVVVGLFGCWLLQFNYTDNSYSKTLFAYGIGGIFSVDPGFFWGLV